MVKSNHFSDITIPQTTFASGQQMALPFEDSISYITKWLITNIGEEIILEDNDLGIKVNIKRKKYIKYVIE